MALIPDASETVVRPRKLTHAKRPELRLGENVRIQ